MKKRLNAKHLARTLILLVLATTLAGCELLGALGGGLGVNGLSLLGVTPASDYRQTGNIEVSMLPKSENSVVLGSLSSFGVGAEVEDETGTMQECDFVGEDTEYASYFNSVALLIDDSGSMGREYEPDVCATCPHDPENERAKAAGELARIVYEGAPDSNIAVMDFGPDPEAGSGLGSTRVLADFSTDFENVNAAIQLVDGTQEVGTPLWDALAETIDAIEVNAQSLEDAKENGETRVNSEIPQSTEGNPKTDNVKRYLIVLSDGADTLSQTHTLDSVVSAATAKNVVIYAVGLGPAAADSAAREDAGVAAQIDAVQSLQKLAEKTGGFYASVQDAAQLQALYKQVGLAMTEGYQTATFDCGEATKPDSTPGAEPRHISGNLTMGEFISVPFGFLEPSN